MKLYYRSLLREAWHCNKLNVRRTMTHQPVTMKAGAYQQHSMHQYDAHTGCQDFLEGALERLARRMVMEDMYSITKRRRRHVVDLGAADGSNSMRTLQWAVQTLRQHTSPQDKTIPLHVTFEEHPASRRDILKQTLQQNDEWFASHDITYDILMKSFYEPLFPKESVDLFLCYICLHWLDTTATNSTLVPVSEWKQWRRRTRPNDNDDDDDDATTDNNNQLPPPDLHNFVFMNEATVPHHLQVQWKKDLARRHLAQFLALRARELRPGAEAILMMVGQPNEYVNPPKISTTTMEHETSASALTRAMQHCVQQGTVRTEVLQRLLVPYYTRTLDDLRDALTMAAEIEVDITTGNEKDEEERFPGSLLKLVDAKAYNVNVAKDSIDGAFDMFWSIHCGAISGAGATMDELECIRHATQTMFHSLFNADDGVNITYLACLIRRQTRKAW
eukprot:scaffold4060_cov190-Amphora_coffeaeformis.AAC.16